MTKTELRGFEAIETAKVEDHELTPQAAAELAHANDVMQEQLEYLVDVTSEHGLCGCSDCQRYLRVRSVLLEIFEGPPAKRLRAIASLARAA
jgi:hypothetical protein